MLSSNTFKAKNMFFFSVLYCIIGPGQYSSIRKTAKKTEKEGTKLIFLDDTMVYLKNSK